MDTPVYFITGFPGFLSSRIIRKLLDREVACTFELLVHPSQIQRAQSEIEGLRAGARGTQAQFHLLPGDITVPNLGLDETANQRLKDSVTHVFHLAAIYDLAVAEAVARKVNVVGTGNVNQWALQLRSLQRYVYFSTAYVSGTRWGRILETELECGQGFKNFYEATKYEAEVLVQEIRNEMPVTIIRPGIVVGDSRTGETVKFDGPYFIMRFLDKFAHLPVPFVGRGAGQINLVPVDYVVNATCFLAHSDKGINKVYHLTDSHPHTARDALRLISKTLIGKEPSYTLPATWVSAVLSIPSFRRWVMVERETVEYFRLRSEYDCTQATADLAGSGIACPDLADYVSAVVGFYQRHREDTDKLILVGGKPHPADSHDGQHSGYEGLHWR